MKTTSGQAAAIVKKWKFQDEMSFLLPFMQDRATVSSLEITNTQNSKVDKDNEVVSEITETGIDELVNEEMPSETRAPKRSAVRQQQLPNRKKTEQTTASAVVMDYLLKMEEKDEVEALFYGLAQTVKQLPPYYRALAKSKVSSIVGEIELQSLTTPNPSAMMSSTFVHPSNTAYQTQEYTASVSTPLASPETSHYSSLTNISHVSTPMRSPSTNTQDFYETIPSNTQEYYESFSKKV